PHVYTVFTQDERKYGRMNYGEKLGLTEDGRRIYLEPDGAYKKPGSMIVNHDLANTLEIIARDGAEAFYTGELARRIIDDIRANGGVLSERDLAEFQVFKTDPLSVDFRGWRVAMPAPPGGGVLVAQILKMLERFDLVGMGFN